MEFSPKQRRELYIRKWRTQNAETVRAYGKALYYNNHEYRATKRQNDAFKRHQSGGRICKRLRDELIENGFELTGIEALAGIDASKSC
jgi:predicted N-acetyltransferase YhbS